jgi:hypothetical protein
MASDLPFPEQAAEPRAAERPLGCLILIALVLIGLCAFGAFTLADRVAVEAGQARVGRVQDFPTGSVTPLWFNGTQISRRATGRPAVIWLVHGPSGFLALYTASPEQQAKAPPGGQVSGWPQPPVDCTIEWRPYDRQFAEPCTGSLFDEQGRLVQGGSPRGLDRFAVHVDGEVIVIDGRAVTPGPAR